MNSSQYSDNQWRSAIAGYYPQIYLKHYCSHYIAIHETHLLYGYDPVPAWLYFFYKSDILLGLGDDAACVVCFVFYFDALYNDYKYAFAEYH